jgi:hypothetical protein
MGFSRDKAKIDGHKKAKQQEHQAYFTTILLDRNRTTLPPMDIIDCVEEIWQ